MLDHPRSAIVGFRSVLNFCLDAIYILCFLAWNCLFTPILLGFWGPISPIYGHPSFLSQKDHPCAETRRLSHKAWKSVQRFDLGAWSRKKDRTGQPKKSQSGNISPIWGEAPTSPIETKICMVGLLADIITCAKFHGNIFNCYDFTEVEFPIFLLIFAWALQQFRATALPVKSHMGFRLVPMMTLDDLQRRNSPFVFFFTDFDFFAGQIRCSGWI